MASTRDVINQINQNPNSKSVTFTGDYGLATPSILTDYSIRDRNLATVGNPTGSTAQAIRDAREIQRRNERTLNSVIESQSTPASTPTTSGGNSGSGSSGFDYNAMYSSLMGSLQSALEAQQAQMRAQYENALASLRDAYNKNKSGLESDSADAKRQAYVNYMLGKRGLNQTLSNQGINGGATESILANLFNTYGSNRAGIDKEYARAMDDLTSEYNNGVASLGANYGTNYANALTSYYDKLANVQQNYASDLLSMMKSNNATKTTNTSDNEEATPVNTSLTGRNLGSGDEEEKATGTNYLSKITQATADSIKNRIKQIYGTSNYSDEYNDSQALNYLQQMAAQYGLTQEQLAQLAAEAGY